MSSDPLLTWEAILGEPLLRFVLNQDAGALQNLSEDQRMALYELDSGGVLGERDDPRLPVALGAVFDDQPSRAWRLRARAGGEIPEPVGEDQLGRALTQIARDSYPVLLSLPDLTVGFVTGRSLPASDPSIGLAQLTMAHPQHEVAQRELAVEAGKWQDVVIETILSRIPLSAEITPSTVIGAAAERWRHRPGAEAHQFLGDVLDCLAALRRLGAGETADSVALIGLRGLQLEADLEYELPVGILRAPTAHEARYSPFAQVTEPIDAVLVVPTELTPTPPDVAPEASMSKQLDVVELARSVSLASAISRRADRDSLSAIATSWITEWTPLPGSGTFKPGPMEQWVPKAQYGRVEMEALAGWIGRIQSVQTDQIGIAIDRTMRAIFEIEAGESLIDAVIAWENLFGSRIETTYKVTASLAVLCEDDSAKRIAFRKELGDLYEKRSRLVHGDESGAEFQDRNRAIQIGLEAIARLIEKRPELLALAKSSKRADRLLLGIGG